MPKKRSSESKAPGHVLIIILCFDFPLLSPVPAWPHVRTRRSDGTIENLSKNFHWTATRGQSSVSTSWTQPFGEHSRTSVLELSRTWNVLTQNTAKCSIRGAYTHVTSQRSRTRVCVNVHVCNTYDFICVGRKTSNFFSDVLILDSNNICRNSIKVYMHLRSFFFSRFRRVKYPLLNYVPCI